METCPRLHVPGTSPHAKIRLVANWDLESVRTWHKKTAGVAKLIA